MQQRQATSERQGWVTRSYPAVLERWTLLTDTARVAAQILYSQCQPFEIVEIVHNAFYLELGRKDEKASRRAFDCLEAVGVLRCVYRRRGRYGRQIYRLGDPVAAYQRRGMGVTEPDPQLVLPFAVEAVQSQDDLGGGILRLHVPADEFQSGSNAGLTSVQSGSNAGLNLNPAPTPDSNLDEERADREKVGPPQHSTCPRTDGSQGVVSSGVAAMEPSGERRGTDHPPPARSATAAGFGTGDASRTGALASQLPQEISFPTSNTNQPTNQPIALASASARAGPAGPEYDVDAYIGRSQELEQAKVDRVAERLARAIRAAERRVGAAKRMQSPWICYEWGRACARPDVPIDEGYVSELIDDLGRWDALTNPGGLANARLRELLAKAGVRLRRAK